MLSNFKHIFPIQIRFNDFDGMGHVNNATYLTYVELARLDYFCKVVGPDTDWSKQHGLILGRAEIDFKSPIYFGNQVTIYTRCSRLGEKSFDLSWLMMRTRGASDLVAQGKSVLVCYDYETKKSVHIREDYRKCIQNFEQNISL